MMLFWITALSLALLSTLWIARPFLFRGSLEMNDAEGAISVFRDQHDEIDRDLAQGLISPEERDAAHREIEQRALRAARNLSTGMTMSQRSLPVAAGIVAVCVVATALGYNAVGLPEFRDQPLAERKMEVLQARAAAGDMTSQISLLIEKTAQNPDSFEDWWTLGASYATTGDYASAVDAFRRAAELGGDRPGVMSAYAEAMVLANGNKVPTAARVIFEQVLQEGPEPRARYYTALAKAQSQQFQAALDDWSALAAESQADAPWMPLVRRDIVNMVRFTKTELTDYLPDATTAEIAMAGGAPATEVALAQADEIEAALARDPMDYKGWITLAQIRSAQGDDAAAQAAIEAARGHYAAAPFVLQKLDEAAQAMGLDILAASPGVSGPSDADIAAASEMTAEDRNAMVEGMVAGLAAKLEDNPDNADGWIMLVRSYTVLGKPDKARQSYDAALAHFDGQPAVVARLQAEAGSVVGAN